MNEQNYCARYFEIRKYAFLIFEKGNNQKIVLRFVSILFLMFEKENKQKNCAKICKYAF